MFVFRWATFFVFIENDKYSMPTLPPQHHPIGWEPHTENAKAYDKARGNSHQRGYDSRWRKASAAYLAANPYCERCLANNVVTPATLVHHIEPVEEAPDRILDPSNWMALDSACHQLIHAHMRKRGFDK